MPSPSFPWGTRSLGFTQELQAEVNQELLETLNEIELNDWNRFGKVRQAWEKWQ